MYDNDSTSRPITSSPTLAQSSNWIPVALAHTHPPHLPSPPPAPHYIIDGGCNAILLPELGSYLTNKKSIAHETALLGDGSTGLQLISSGLLGSLPCITANISRGLIGESPLLQPPNHLAITKWGTAAYIYQPNGPIEIDGTIIATATLASDGLFYIDNLDGLRDFTPLSAASIDTLYSHGVRVDASSLVIANVGKRRDDFLQGTQPMRVKKQIRALNPLEVLHVVMGHAPERVIRHAIKHKLIKGLKYTLKDLVGWSLGRCGACNEGRFHQFPVYPSLRLRIFLIFQCISADIIDCGLDGKVSIDGFRYFLVIVDYRSRKVFLVPLVYKSDFLAAFKRFLRTYGSGRNERSHRLQYLCMDSGSEQLAHESLQFMVDNDIRLCLSTPYVHELVLAERFIQILKNGLRTTLAYNRAPYMWFVHAAKHFVWTRNRIPSGSSMETPEQIFTGLQSDLSVSVPFFALGDVNVTQAESGQSSTFGPKSLPCRMLGYADESDYLDNPQISHKVPDAVVEYKRGFHILIESTNRRYVRSDCIFEIAPEFTSPSLLHSDPSVRASGIPDTYDRSIVDKNLGPQESDITIFARRSTRVREQRERERLNAPSPTAEVPASQDAASFRTEVHEPMVIADDAADEIVPHLPSAARPDGDPFAYWGDDPEYGPDPQFYNVSTSATHRLWNELSTKLVPIINNVRLNFQASSSLLHPPYSVPPPPQPAPVRIAASTLRFPEVIAAAATTSPAAPFSPPLTDELLDAIASAAQPILGPVERAIYEAQQNLFDDYNAELRAKLVIISVINAIDRDRKEFLASLLPFDTRSPTYIVANAEINAQISQIIDDAPIEIDLPKSIEDALRGPDGKQWLISKQIEDSRIMSRRTWEELSLSEQYDPSIKAIKSKYALRLSQTVDGKWKYKVRLVACGYSQVEGRDYTATYAPTAAYKSICTTLQLIATFNWEVQGLDIENAFIESDLDEVIYMDLPKSFDLAHPGKHHRVRLIKSLYGLKQAGERFYQLLKSKLAEHGLHPTAHDQCVFVKLDPETGQSVYVVSFVDDLIVTGSDPTWIDSTIEHIHSSFRQVTGTDLRRYIGVDIVHDRANGTVQLTQAPYIHKITSARLSSDPPYRHIPMAPSVDYHDMLPDDTRSLLPEVGELRFLADKTVPALLAPLSILARFAASPNRRHLSAVRTIYQYLATNPHNGVTFSQCPSDEIRLWGMADASHISHGDSKSQLGFALFLNLSSGTVCARSARDTTVSLSSTDAEIKAVKLALREIIWFRGFLAELGFPQNEPTVLMTDNTAAIALATEYQLTRRSAHLTVTLNFIHEHVQTGTIALRYINTDNNVADVLTKPLAADKFNQHSESLSRGFGGVQPFSYDTRVVSADEAHHRRLSELQRLRGLRTKNIVKASRPQLLCSLSSIQ